MSNILYLRICHVKENARFPVMENGHQVLYDYRQEHV